MAYKDIFKHRHKVQRDYWLSANINIPPPLVLAQYRGDNGPIRLYFIVEYDFLEVY